MPFYNEISDKTNIVISFTNIPKNDFGVFGRGYHRAANLLANELMERTSFADYDGYPVVFLYRHSFELYLKNIIYKSTFLCLLKSLSDPSHEFYNKHNLIKLAKLATSLLGILFPSDEQIMELCVKIKEISKEFADIDENSYSYRYPISKTGKYSTVYHQVVNIYSIARNMDLVLDSMDTINFGLNIEIDKETAIFEILENIEGSDDQE